jgi:transcriptional regulator with XRE-family HTH domain
MLGEVCSAALSPGAAYRGGMKITTATELASRLGERLARARTARGIASQTELARRLKKHPSTVHYWEAGETSPKLYDLYRICAELRITADWLLFGKTEGLSQEAFDLLESPSRQG